LAKIDPRLRAKLEAAGRDGDIKAVISLATNKSSFKSSSSEEPEATISQQKESVQEILARAQDATSQRPKSVKHLPSLGVLIVEGSAAFIRKLLDCPEVSSATISDEEHDVVKV
jgi:hypothetical protein